MLALIKNLLPVKQWMLIAAVALVVATATATWKTAAWRYGQQITAMENAAYQAQIAAMNSANEINLRNRQLSDAAAELHAIHQQKQKTVTQYINREVIKYVQSPDAGQCQLPDDWVRTYDAAAANMSRSPASSGGADDDTTRITDIEVLQNAGDNYGACNQIRQQLIDLQNWVRGDSNG